jgi:NADH-quinone oxidoreductase subunit J
MVAQNIFFYLFAALILGSALAVVTTRNVVRAALYLVMVFGGVAGIYIMLAAEFLAVTQVLVYIGAIMVLMLFGIMLTRARIGKEPDLTHSHWWVGAATAILLFGVMAYALVDSYEDHALASSKDEPTSKIAQVEASEIDTDLRIDHVEGSNTSTISDALFSTYLVPFEAVSVLLLASLVGAIVIARKDR